METHMVYTKYNGKIHEGMITMVLIAHKVDLIRFWEIDFWHTMLAKQTIR
jgi:hypothetical protein